MHIMYVYAKRRVCLRRALEGEESMLVHVMPRLPVARNCIGVVFLVERCLL
jgi:hypothetical protein